MICYSSRSRSTSVEVRNRVIMPAFGLMYCTDRKVSQRYIDFYEARAKGGCGLIIVGGCGIDFVGGGPMMLGIDDDSFIPGYEKLAEAVHKPRRQTFHPAVPRRQVFIFVPDQAEGGCAQPGLDQLHQGRAARAGQRRDQADRAEIRGRGPARQKSRSRRRGADRQRRLSLSTSSFPRSPTCAPTNTAEVLKSAQPLCSRPSTACAKKSGPIMR